MRIIYNASLAIAFIVSLFVAGQAHAEGACRHSLEVKLNLLARFVTLPDAPAFTAMGEGEVCYQLKGDGAVIFSESIPRLIFRGEELPGNLRGITVVVDAMPGVNPALDWRGFPEVKLSNVDFRVRAFDGAAAEVDASGKPLVDIILSKLTFATGLIDVEGWESFGHLDADEPSAMLVGSVVLPPHSHPAYSEWLAGEPVLLELTVRVRNPYSKG